MRLVILCAAAGQVPLVRVGSEFVPPHAGHFASPLAGQDQEANQHVEGFGKPGGNVAEVPSSASVSTRSRGASRASGRGVALHGLSARAPRRTAHVCERRMNTPQMCRLNFPQVS